MTISRPWRPWVSPPLVVQILALLIGALVVAQLVTLLLILVLPPEPPKRYEIGDIARALRGAASERPFDRHVEPGPPDLTERGWLVSPTTTAELARALGLPTARVAFGFYTALPVAGLAGTPPPPPRPPADARPAQIGTATGETVGSFARELGALALDWAVPPASAQQSGPPPGGRPGGGGGGPVRATNGGDGAEIPRSGGPGMSAGRFGGGSAGPGGMAGTARSETPMATRAEQLRAQLDRWQPSGGATRTAEGSQRTAMPDGNARLAPGVAGPPGRAEAPMAIRSNVPTGWLPTPATRTTTIPVPEAIPVRLPAAVETAAPPRPTPIRSALPRPAPSAGTATQAAPLSPPVSAIPKAAAPPATRVAVRPPATFATPVPIVRPSSGLFGLAAAPFIEGDFIAAARLADGRWITVAPVAEGFPNAWQRRVLLWFGLALVAVAPIAWAFARNIVGPLKGFAAAAERLGRDPSAAILPLDGPAEVGRAAHAFNQMGSRLRSFVDDRTAMIGAISHDLRTPLTRLRFRIEDVPDDQHAGLLGEVEAMEAMISSVIAYMRDAATPGVRERRDLAELVGDVVEDAALIGGDVRTVRAEPAPVDIDALGVRRVLDNLLTNAIKYGGGVARIALKVEDACAVADIVDDGPGIPDAELERVFEPFYRSEAARASSREGSGLGLAVCRSIARAHGGDVRLFRSPSGFTARVTLPLAYDGERQLAA